MKFVLNTLTFYLEDDILEKKSFNGETIRFTLQLIKIKIKGAFENIKLIVIALVKNTTLAQKTLLVI